MEDWKGMTAGQRRKASDACLKLATYACSTSSDGTLTVASTPGAGKKTALAQTQACRKKTNTVTSKKRPCVDSLESDDDDDDDFE